jgi:hypothetical protein
MLALCLAAVPARAHVGSKDVFEEVSAGPYKLFVTIRTPTVIPGVATVEVRASGPEVRSIAITPVPLTGEAAKHPPTADAMTVSSADPAFFTGSLWLMASGSWQVKLEVEGAAGAASAGVPVPAIPLSILPMQQPLEVTLGLLGFVLALGMAGIVAAAVREARLAPGVAPTPARRRRALVATCAAFVGAVAAIALGGLWWHAEAASYAEDIYHPLSLSPRLQGDALDLSIGRYSPEKKIWLARSNDDFLLDHGHLMHLYAIREPEMDAVFHLHPVATANGHMGMALPQMPAGTYKLYGDVVHANGFPETLTSELMVPAGFQGAALGAEDASAAPAPLDRGDLGPAYTLPDGYTMVWDRPAAVHADTAYVFRFTLLDAAGRPAEDMRPYLGMAGHAAFVKTDGTVFAHTHPEGSAAMPAMMLANAGDGMPGMPAMGAGAQTDGPVSPVVTFPYGFPSAGRYRVFVQMKHGGTVETGVFDVEVK